MAYMADCCKNAVEKFREVFGKSENPKVAVFAPGRVNLIGEHTDYNGGFVLPMALPLVTVIVGRLSVAGMCRVATCATFDDQPSVHKFLVPSYPPDKPKLVETDSPKWARYVQGVVALLNKGGNILPFDAVIASSVPLGGGVSSSASLEVAMCLFVEQLCPPATPLSPKERALLCQQAEHRYAGVPCGIMDQFVSVMAKDNHALLIDCCTQGTEDIPLSDHNLVVMVTNTNYKHELVAGEYQERRESCESAAAKLGKALLKEVTMEELEAHKDKLTKVEYMRARHVISEIQRTLDAVEALKAGDYQKFGRLMHESHCSLRDDYEVSCQELDQLVELALQGKEEGVYGSRMTGGGFGGCTVTLLHRNAVEKTKQRIEANYKSREGKPATFYEATPSRGADVIPHKLLKQFLGKKALKNPGLHVNVGEKQPATPPVPTIPQGIDSIATITIGSDTFQCSADDLMEEGELGRGAYGSVYRMRHKETNTLMAVKRIRATIDSVERKRLLMDLNVSMRSLDCPYTVTFYGALFREGDVWICMELMDKSLHQLYKLVYDTLHLNIPEPVIGKMAESTIKALYFLKFKLNVLHRDVKPSNILISRNGEIKLCDFGIAGELVNSFCQTDIGCKPYLAPERINPVQSGAKYDQRSDVWSFGITIYELALGKFPYPAWKNVFDQLKTVVEGEAPKVPADLDFSQEFKDFVHLCLTKKVEERPKYDILVEHSFIKKIEQTEVDVGAWYRDILDKEEALKG